MTNLKDIITSLEGRYTAACNAAGIKPIKDFEYNIATGCGDEYIAQLETTGNNQCIALANEISTTISRI